MFKYRLEIVCALFCLVCGMMSGIVNTELNMQWHDQLIKPSFNPPSWVFSPVWTILYLLMGVTLATLLKTASKNKFLLTIFGLQFICNIIWSTLFFEIKRIDWALLDLSAIWLFLLIFLIRSRYTRVFYLSIPYFCWASYALLLNFYIYMLN